MKAHLISFLLKRNNPIRNDEKSARKALQLFRKVAESSVWYQAFLNKNRCSISEIKSVCQFEQQVPLLSKELVFGMNRYTELVQCDPRQIALIMLSSGHSGAFSIGMISRKECRKFAKQTDLFLELLFGIKKGEALIINASAMGVRVFTNHTCCDTGPRVDIVVAVLKQVAPTFQQSVVIADPHLVKQIAEESIQKGINWSKLKVWFVSGGDWFSESLRSYVHSLIGKSASVPGNGFWSAVFGITELGYPLFFETAQLAEIRSKMSRDRSFVCDKLSYIQGKCTPPFLFNYFQSNFHVESIQNKQGVPELVFTTIGSNRAIHLVRYNTGDIGAKLPPKVFGSLDFSLPIVAFWGRNRSWIDKPSGKLLITDIKELLFSNFELAAKVTGYFTLQYDSDTVELSIQLKKGVTISSVEQELFELSLKQICTSVLNISFGSYHQFETQMELDFERKFNHLIS